MASIVNSTLSPQQQSHLRLDFQKASVSVSTLYRYTNAHWRFDLPPNTQDDPTLAAWHTLQQDFAGSHTQQLQEILDAREQNIRPPVSGDDARRIIEFTASLYKSAWTRQPVQRGEITPADPFYYSNNGAHSPQGQAR